MVIKDKQADFLYPKIDGKLIQKIPIFTKKMSGGEG